MVYSESAARRPAIRLTGVLAIPLLLVLTALFLSCTGTGVRRTAETGAASPGADRAAPLSGVDFAAPLRFVPDSLPGLRPALGAGLVTREQRDPGGALTTEERDRLSGGFKDAYVEGLLRGLSLEGVLGGDMVHGWPAAAPLAWVQNWRSGEGAPNSWAVPSLVLALRGLTHDRVFIVQGEMLDAYGKSAGRGGANGVSGYGAPRGGEFFHEGGVAQRFDYGLMKIGGEGTVFIEEDPPSALAEAPEMPGGDRETRERFRSAWKAAADRNYPLRSPDTNLVHIGFGSPWIITAKSRDGSETAITLRGIWYQRYAGGQALLLLADAPELPPYPRLLVSPWLDAFLAAPEKRLPGAEFPDSVPPPEYRSGGDENFVRSLLDSIAFYGIPLSDRLPLPEPAAERPADGETAAPEGAAPASTVRYYEAQRFSKGWMRDN
ncbi:MAG: hypothetical protein LBS06_06450 [Treponema sp.]|jgi:hypothetical protein|nr:hypothetical protein [Treponema sp.]